MRELAHKIVMTMLIFNQNTLVDYASKNKCKVFHSKSACGVLFLVCGWVQLWFSV